MSIATERLSPLARRVAVAGAWPRGTRLLVACSGGSDSLALLLLLDELRRAGRVALVVGHVNHGLRPTEALADREHVVRVAAALGVPVRSVHADALAELAVRRRGLEDAARSARRRALEELRAGEDCQDIVVAHTADDQAETILLRLLRGSGPEALTGLAPRSGRTVRPLLGVRRAELRALLRHAGLSWRSDATNWGNTSVRGLLRPLLGRLELEINESLAPALAASARMLADDGLVLSGLAAEAAARLARGGRDDAAGPRAPLSVAVGPDGLAGLEPALRRRVLRLLLRRIDPRGAAPAPQAVAAVLALAAGRAGRAASVSVAGGSAWRAGDDLVLGGPTPAAAWPRAPRGPLFLPVPGEIRWGRGTVRAAAAERRADDPRPWEGAARAVLDQAAAGEALELRCRRPGDRFRPVGAPVPRNLAGYLKDRGVPRDLRDEIPLLCRAGAPSTILWVGGAGVAHEARVTDATRRLLQVEWRPEDP